MKLEITAKIDNKNTIGVWNNVKTSKDAEYLFQAVINSFIFIKTFGWKKFQKHDKAGFTIDGKLTKKDYIKLKNIRNKFYANLHK